MKVIILAGGRGTRLPISARDIPKPLVEVAGRPIIQHQIERFHAAGLSDIRLALHFRADQIIDFINRNSYACEYVIEPEPLGTGGAVRFAMRDLTGPALILNGDILGNFDLRAMTDSYRPGEATLMAHWKEDARDFGLLHIEGDRVMRFMEKPKEAVAGYTSVGCYILEPEHFAGIPEGPFMLERDLFPELARQGRIRAHIHTGFWDDLGTEERLAGARADNSSFFKQ